jgi:hypothetical protein
MSGSVPFAWGEKVKPKTASPLERLRRFVRLLVLLVGLGLFGAACGVSHSSGVANIGSTAKAPSASSSSGTSARYRAALAYVDCMRSHGVSDFPDPGVDGQIDVDFAHGGKGGSPATPGIDRNSPQYISADQRCRHLLPGGVPTPAQNQRALAEGLKLAQCMRSHGVPNYPDPNPSDPQAVRLNGVDPSSPLFQTAQKACALLLPETGTK